MAWAPHSCFSGKARAPCGLSWQGSLEFPHLAGTGAGGRRREDRLVTDWEGWHMLAPGEVLPGHENSPL